MNSPTLPPEFAEWVLDWVALHDESHAIPSDPTFPRGGAGLDAMGLFGELGTDVSAFFFSYGLPRRTLFRSR